MGALVKRFGRPAVIAVLVTLAVLVVAMLVTLAARTPRRSTPAPTPRSGVAPIEAYRGLGTWVDLWDAKAWRNPEAVVADMERHGVRTLYVQTASSHTTGGVANPAALSTFITEAHARHMYVVAWYLPSLKADPVDYTRIMQAIEFKTADGQQVDSFALDIESTAIKSLSVRNKRLAALSAKVRTKVGTGYPLGGIIPSPVGLMKKTGFWNVFPYKTVATYYDVLLPMAYYTFHGHGAAAAYADASANMRILRAQNGCSEVPVHLIGGIAGTSTAAEMAKFSIATSETGCVGASTYDWVGMSDAKWTALRTAWAGATP